MMNIQEDNKISENKYNLITYKLNKVQIISNIKYKLDCEL